MQVFHTAGVPPSSGSTKRLNIGCTRKSRKALVKMAAVKTASTQRCAAVGGAAAGASAASAGGAATGVCWLNEALRVDGWRGCGGAEGRYKMAPAALPSTRVFGGFRRKML